MDERRPRPADAEERRRRRIERRVEAYMAAEALFPADGRLLVAVSGGPDSTALLLILSRLAGRRRLELVAAYFDHGLRGKAAADEERAAVLRLAAAAEVDLETGAGDVRRAAKEGRLSLEEAARRERYRFLAATARRRGIAAVAAGHTADDQAETVLMHLLRGAGLAGLAGMAPRSRWPDAREEGLALLRPLLCLTRAETESYCRAVGVEPLDDASNRSPAFLRNRVRHEVLPFLRRFNPALDSALGRLADAARADLEFIEHVAGGAVRRSEEGVRIERSLLREWPPALRRHAIRIGLLRSVGDLQGFSRRHIAALEAAALGPGSGARVDLPRGLAAAVARDALVITPAGSPPAEPLPKGEVTLPVPGEADFGPLRLRAGKPPIDDAAGVVALDAGALGEGVIVRRRRPGDRFQPSGMEGTKKLQDFFVDAHVPRRERDRVPIFETERGIAWVGGLRAAGWALPGEGAPKVTLSYAWKRASEDAAAVRRRRR